MSVELPSWPIIYFLPSQLLILHNCTEDEYKPVASHILLYLIVNLLTCMSPIVFHFPMSSSSTSQDR